MAGESRLSEQESGFNTAKSKGIRLSGLLSRAKGAATTGERRGDGERIRMQEKNKGREKEGLREEGAGETEVPVARAAWQQEKHDGKLCGTEK